ncbi:MAG TPA: ATP-binding cassette domain-containing protein [Chryseolinea sp.]|nr:ATP-binding cassette domain-containing protein [Chryseolinea sp.]HPM29337.1 ATP-binding cassette domain-containing protein [Chryseolinea sp.]
MLDNYQIVRILHEASLMLKHNFDSHALRFVDANQRNYGISEFTEFKRDLIEAGSKVKFLFLEYPILDSEFTQFINEENACVLVFEKQDEILTPILLKKNRGKVQALKVGKPNTSLQFEDILSNNLYKDEEGRVLTFTIFPYKSLVSEYSFDETQEAEKMSPVRRFVRLLRSERQQIYYIFFYAVIVGMLSLILPIGIQTIVELVSGGVFFSSVYVLIGLVIIGILITGGLQIMQISLVEHLQRRIFTKAAFEFAFRIPRIRVESLMGNYAPELVNRFFDILTIQKGLPKLLIDLASAAIQIVFSLILLSLYHPFFIFFSMVLVLVLFLIFYATGARGLSSSISESKYKYKVVQWLEELARAINIFKLSGTTDLPVKRTDFNLNNYLKYRKLHFEVLVTQFSFIVLFKAAITGGLLIMGTILVVNREITLGQFVASEVIIILLLNAVEKIIMYMDVVYDLLTAVDKVATVTDLPLERVGGIDFPRDFKGGGYSLSMRNVSFTYPNAPKQVLNNISLDIQRGERICISGQGNSGKSTLMDTIVGLHPGFEGSLTINNYSIRDLDLTHMRDHVVTVISQEDIFDGTILENLTHGKRVKSMNDVIESIEKAGIADDINKLPHGLNTNVLSGGKGFSATFNHRLLIASCFVQKPELLILHDFFAGLSKMDKLEMLNTMIDKRNGWTMLTVSNDPIVMTGCDRVVILADGKIQAIGKFEDLQRDGLVDNYIE